MSHRLSQTVGRQTSRPIHQLMCQRLAIDRSQGSVTATDQRLVSALAQVRTAVFRRRIRVLCTRFLTRTSKRIEVDSRGRQISPTMHRTTSLGARRCLKSPAQVSVVHTGPSWEPAPKPRHKEAVLTPQVSTSWEVSQVEVTLPALLCSCNLRAVSFLRISTCTGTSQQEAIVKASKSCLN